MSARVEARPNRPPRKLVASALVKGRACSLREIVPIRHESTKSTNALSSCQVNASACRSGLSWGSASMTAALSDHPECLSTRRVLSSVIR